GDSRERQAGSTRCIRLETRARSAARPRLLPHRRADAGRELRGRETRQDAREAPDVGARDGDDGRELPRRTRPAARAAPWTPTRSLARRREADVEDVTVLDGIGLPLEALQPPPRGLRMRAGLDEVRPADHLAADEATRDVAVDRSGGVECRLAAS